MLCKLFRNLLRKITYRRSPSEVLIRLGNRPRIYPVAPGNPESYRRAARDVAALEEKARERVYQLRDDLLLGYLERGKPLWEAKRLADTELRVKQAIEDQKFYERLTNYYRGLAMMEARSPGSTAVQDISSQRDLYGPEHKRSA